MLIPLKYDSKTLCKEQPSGVISLLASVIVQAYALPQLASRDQCIRWQSISIVHCN